MSKKSIDMKDDILFQMNYQDNNEPVHQNNNEPVHQNNNEPVHQNNSIDAITKCLAKILDLI